MIKRTLSTAGLCTLMLLLSACATTNSRFGCNATATRACTAVGEVNRRAALGRYDASSTRHPAVDTSHPQTSGHPRHPEQLARVWLAPYTDREQVYHEAAYVDVVVSPAHWSSNESGV